jgi:hypothetical protein
MINQTILSEREDEKELEAGRGGKSKGREERQTRNDWITT